MANSSPGGAPSHLVFLDFKTQINIVQRLMQGEQTQISAECAQLQHLFESQVQELDWEDWSVPRRSLLQSIRVEMHKQLRLLSTDLMFLKAAKQVETLEQRRQDIGDRLTHLQGYCDAILKLAEETSPHES